MMSARLGDTHDPALTSWVESANDPATDFPIQNLPFGRFRRAGATEWRIGIAIGDAVLDLRRAALIDTDDMNRVMSAGTAARTALRRGGASGLRGGASQAAARLRSRVGVLRRHTQRARRVRADRDRRRTPVRIGAVQRLDRP